MLVILKYFFILYNLQGPTEKHLGDVGTLDKDDDDDRHSLLAVVVAFQSITKQVVWLVV